MMDRINFTGLKNIGGMYNIEINANPYNQFGYLKPIERKYLIVKLTNDENGNDLDKFNQSIALCTPELDTFEFQHDKKYINIFTEKPYHQDKTPELFLNLQKVPITRRTIPIFDYLAKLTRKIANKQDAEFVYEKNFFQGPSNIYIMGDTAISDISSNQADYINKTLDIYNPQTSRYIAQSINDSIQEQMTDYFM